jgi:hypothetical protein
MSAEITTNKLANAAAYRTTHILLNASNSTVAGGTSDIAFSGDYVCSVNGNFSGGNAATVALNVKRVGENTFKRLFNLPTDKAFEHNKNGSAVAVLNKGDQVFAQLSNITNSPAVTVTLTFNKD